MAGSSLARRKPESIDDFMNRRFRELEHLGSEAQATAHQVYRKAIRAGQDLNLPTAGDVMAYGANLLQGKGPRPGAKPASTSAAPPRGPAGHSPSAAQVPRRTSPSPPSSRATPGGGWMGALDRNPYAKAAGGYAAMVAGNLAGVNRGALHMAEGVLDGAAFVKRLTDPRDVFTSPPGESAGAQLLGAGKSIFDYGRSGVANPKRVVDDIRSGASKVYADLVPSATPTADTFSGELRRMYGIGQNQGELAVNIAAVPAGGEFVEGLAGVRAAELRGATRYLAEGGHADAARYLDKPYAGKGHHSITPERKGRLPKVLGGGPTPRFIMDSPFNVLKFNGLTQGEGYALHAMVDPYATHFRLPNKLGVRSWSAAKAGVSKLHGLERIWYGTPEATKTAIGGLVGGVGGVIHEPLNGEDAW